MCGQVLHKSAGLIILMFEFTGYLKSFQLKSMDCRFLADRIETPATSSRISRIRLNMLACIFQHSHLKSNFVLLQSFSAGSPCPFIFADFALFQFFSYNNFLAPALRTPFFSTHSCLLHQLNVSFYLSIAMVFLKGLLSSLFII